MSLRDTANHEKDEPLTRGGPDNSLSGARSAKRTTELFEAEE